MDRRQFLINLSVLIGTSVTSLNTAAIEAALTFDSKTIQPMFKVLQRNTIKAIADIIIPQTDTPSASAANVHLYVDHYVHQFMEAPLRQRFIQQLDLLCNDSPSFLQHSANEKLALVQNLDDHMYAANEQSLFYKQLKQLIVIGYYTSEVGATQALNFDPIPGPYQEMKLKDVGRVWF
ncbi:gluconate 2-dehydrogenase subunit 3 family protein [Shewanella donghaensis]|uniref:gluconate 2-dehydrogenase subunit 3 family protein n=1 Tax=Shewanella donghaensis TaxID=238836 RepID=UPI00131529AE|nr:gluconate 2-dehydrogenase subunit 3 family protein [Shewanella donghaensis]